MSKKSSDQVAFSTAQIYKYYFDLAQIFSRRGLKILKTDSHNESGLYSHSIPLMPALSQGNEAQSVEIDDEILDLAKTKHPDLRFNSGDIRALSVEQMFDVVLDFSSIDHVTGAEFEQVLRGYKQIATFASIIVWHSDTRSDTSIQTYFPRADFSAKLAEAFDSEIVNVLVYADRDRELVHHLVGVGPASELVPEILRLGVISRQVNTEQWALWRLKTTSLVQMVLKIDLFRDFLSKVHRKLFT
tara:strand:- start:4892 stop:5623 length:732 start_codon:yes stop_codon:yes gene_type:complete